MEVSIGNGYATISVLDSNFAEVVTFNSVPIVCGSQFCSVGFDESLAGFGRGLASGKR